MKKIISGLILLAIIGISFYACKSSTPKCEVCASTSNVKTQVKFEKEFGIDSVLTNLWYANDVKENYDYADIAEQKDFDFEKFKLHVEKNPMFKIEGNPQIIGYVLYLNKQLHLDPIVKPYSLLAIGIYSYHDKILQHNFFKKNDSANTFIEVSELKASVSGIQINAIHALMKKVVHPKDGSTSFLISNAKEISVLGKITKTSDDLIRIINNYEKSISELSRTSNQELRNFADEGEGGAFCLTPCAPTSSSCWQSTTSQSYVCRGNIICPMRVSFNTVDATDFWANTDSLEKTVKPTTAYQFRDSILSKNAMGQKYISDYYFLGSTFSNSYSFTNSLKILRIMPTVYSIVDKINSTNQTQNTYDTETRDKIVSLINYFKTLTDDAIAIAKMNDIIADVNYYCNKQVSNLKSALTN
jgi:hypothetical protein